MKKVILTILDGVGLRNEETGNAVKQAKTPVLDMLLHQYGYSKLNCSGEIVGLPKGQMGNSEVGHTNLGAGRIVLQPLEYINQKIRDNSIYQNKTLINTFHHVKKYKSKLHIMGLFSDGGVHSHMYHIIALLLMCKLNKVNNVYFHIFTDGRDTRTDGALEYIKVLEQKIKEYKLGSIATIVGRYYSMDRDKRWDRVEKAYNLLVNGVGDTYSNAEEAIQTNYKNNITDEFILPSLINKNGFIEENDAIIHANFRPDRVKELIETFYNPEFNAFEVKRFNNLRITTLMKTTDADAAYELDKLQNTLGAYLSTKNIKQLRIAETEKYAHVTYFFDGGKELVLPNCKRVLIPSLKVATYDMEPRMKADEVTETLLKEMESGYEFILVNYANGDMVGHTGNMEATIQAMEAVDQNLGLLYNKAKELGYTLLITADHGNAEQMLDEQGNMVTAHTTNQVFFIVCDEQIKPKDGKLGDVAPTILKIMGFDIPKEMTETSLIEMR